MYSLLVNEGIQALAAMHFKEVRGANFTTGIYRQEADDGRIRGRIVQTMDAAICGHAGAERMFCESEDARRVLENGIGMHRADDNNASLPQIAGPDIGRPIRSELRYFPHPHVQHAGQYHGTRPGVPRTVHHGTPTPGQDVRRW